MNKETKYFGWFLTAFVTLVLVSNVIAGRLIQVGPLVVTSAALFFPLSYVLSDIIPEVYGYAKTRKLIWYGVITTSIITLIPH